MRARLSPLYLAGPTASGKSELAVLLAERCNGEIVGADAFQIYHGLDLLTAKPSPELQTRIPHHLISEIPLSQTFDVAQYLALAKPRIEEIAARGKTPIIVGGSGLYLRALIRGLDPIPPRNATLTAELAGLPLEELQHRLREHDPAAAIDWKNPCRVLRALEIVLLTGNPLAASRTSWQQSPAVLGALVTWPREELHARIDCRVEAMFEAGVVEEVKTAPALSLTASQTLGFRQIQNLVSGTITRAECIATIQQATRQYAKRQGTWFRKETALRIVPLQNRSLNEAATEILAS